MRTYLHFSTCTLVRDKPHSTPLHHIIDSIFTMQCLDCQLLAGQQHEFLGKALTVELCHKAFEEKSLQMSLRYQQLVYLT